MAISGIERETVDQVRLELLDAAKIAVSNDDGASAKALAEAYVLLLDKGMPESNASQGESDGGAFGVSQGGQSVIRREDFL